MVSRRAMLAGVAAMPLWSASLRRAEASLDNRLTALAAEKGLSFGTAVTSEQLAGGDAYARLLRDECGVWTPEWQLKWGDVELSPGERSYRGVDAIVAAAAEAGMQVRGHALLWHEQWPDWGADLGAPGDWQRYVEPWLEETVSRYADSIFQWEVVNEPVEPEHGRSDGLRETPFLHMQGPDYLRHAFDLAHAHAPAARLFINEYGICYDEAWQEARRRALLRLIERLLGEGVPLHGIGVQTHLDIANSFSERVFRNFLEELAAFGLDIMLTELDVREGDRTSASLVQRRQRAADEVRRVVSVALEQNAVKGVVTWSLSDRHSWLRYVRGIADNQGLPFDDSYAPTPLRSALVELFSQAETRHA